MGGLSSGVSNVQLGRKGFLGYGWVYQAVHGWVYQTVSHVAVAALSLSISPPRGEARARGAQGCATPPGSGAGGRPDPNRTVTTNHHGPRSLSIEYFYYIGTAETIPAVDCSTAEGGGDLEGAAEDGQRGHLGAGEGGRVGDARLEVGDLGDELDGALAGEEIVLENAAEGDLGEAAVLDLGHGTAVGFEAERVEAVVTGAIKGAINRLLNEGDLKSEDEEENLPSSSHLDKLVMKCPDLLTGVPLSIEWQSEKVLNNKAGCCKHSNTTVLDLRLTRPDDVRPAKDTTIDCPVWRIQVVPKIGFVSESILHYRTLARSRS